MAQWSATSTVSVMKSPWAARSAESSAAETVSASAFFHASAAKHALAASRAATSAARMVVRLAPRKRARTAKSRADAMPVRQEISTGSDRSHNSCGGGGAVRIPIDAVTPKITAVMPAAQRIAPMSHHPSPQILGNW